MLALFRWFAEEGRIQNREKFKKIEDSDGLFEFKNFQIRFIGTIRGREFVIAHGLQKKQDKLPKEALKTAQRILEEDCESLVLNRKV